MFNNKSVFKNKSVPRAAAGVSLLAVVAITIGGCGGGGATHASTSAAAPLRANTQSSDGSGPAATSPDPSSVPATQAPAAAVPVVSAAHKVAPASTATTQAPKPTAPAPPVTTPAPTTPALPARTQPTAAQVNQVIASVHALVPLFTPTQAQIAQVGGQVCTAFDQGKTLAQVKATAMQMAGVYAALLSPSVVNTAVRTIVGLY